MKKGRKTTDSAILLEYWRPPHDAGDPIGCLATTYTFAPELFDEQCLARFLGIESEPDRESIAFLMERENRLGGVYSGVLVDHTQAGVEQSLRWDVLPVRLRAAKQHAKISLLAWSRHIRIIVASANLTEPGYRTNYEVAAAIDLNPAATDHALLSETIAFLRRLLTFVPGGGAERRDIQRADEFLDHVERQSKNWKAARQRENSRQHLVFTVPVAGEGDFGRSSLEEAANTCRKRGGSPATAWIASPFFDPDDETSRVTAALCKMMGRGVQRRLNFCVPAIRAEEKGARPRLAAPISLLKTPAAHGARVTVEMLPDQDPDRNRRYWHAKMTAFQTDRYSALMIGSSNFTCAGMGIGAHRHAEANLLTIVDRGPHKEAFQIESIWPDMEEVLDPESSEWIGARPDNDEDERSTTRPLPAGFLSAIYRAGDTRSIILKFDPKRLPADWSIHACGRDKQELLSAAGWKDREVHDIVEIPWKPIGPPEKLLVVWDEFEAFLPLNVEDAGELPPPSGLENMTSDDMLNILAAADPSAAFRLWARKQQPSDIFDPDVDSATPPDLDPLRRYDLQSTFLHRIRRRARVLALMRANLQKPVWGTRTLDWRLRGMVGVAALADRLATECCAANGAADEALLTLADFLIVLQEVEYQAADGSLSREEFEGIFRPFLADLAVTLRSRIMGENGRYSGDLLTFWDRVVTRCVP